MARKRIHPRLEELTRINVHRRITNRETLPIFHKSGFRFDFIDETADNGVQSLVVFINRSRTTMRFPIVEKRMRGVHSDPFIRYYALVNGKRVQYLYIDFERSLIGSQQSLGATYTSKGKDRKR